MPRIEEDVFVGLPLPKKRNLQVPKADLVVREGAGPTFPRKGGKIIGGKRWGEPHISKKG